MGVGDDPDRSKREPASEILLLVSLLIESTFELAACELIVAEEPIGFEELIDVEGSGFNGERFNGEGLDEFKGFNGEELSGIEFEDNDVNGKELRTNGFEMFGKLAILGKLLPLLKPFILPTLPILFPLLMLLTLLVLFIALMVFNPGPLEDSTPAAAAAALFAIDCLRISFSFSTSTNRLRLYVLLKSGRSTHSMPRFVQREHATVAGWGDG